MLSKKDYKAIAAIIKSEHIDYTNAKDFPASGNHDYDSAVIYTCNSMACELAKYFESQNENFNREKFLSTCGIDI